ncbi:chemotaxis protein CheC [Caldibacillus lycopersici]|uniref:Chemotaxis protein CheC n=1 Tax=Perspicuibacillus lycopersici TaxID=1325689 RepID=A0AAE3IPJ5_9BACI|nr:chemotaxis protein CheC [Perspicuibacillus lycopersici]MCU9612082.1 chemotaxis protein CheC [Perspicuibacillus lycopersici]
MDPIQSISSLQMDVLKEASNIGAGNAATALSKLLNKKIEMNVPVVRILSFAEIMELIGGSEQMVASVFLQIEGDFTGYMFYILPVDEADSFVRQLTGMSNFSLKNENVPEIVLSAFQEMGNILTGSYLAAVSDFTQLQLKPSVPAVGIDMFGAIISYGLLEISQISDFAIVIDTEVSDSNAARDGDLIKGHFFLLPDPDSFTKVFESLGVYE